MQIKLTLDQKVDKDIILALENKANGGAITKALYRAILEWYADRACSNTIQAQDDRIQTPIMPDARPNELTNAIANIEEGW